MIDASIIRSDLRAGRRMGVFGTSPQSARVIISPPRIIVLAPVAVRSLRRVSFHTVWRML
ncbi:MAG: hypothetical protein CME34_20040 [Gordonia sp.]|nr:hypothetical protein [Gordonia sp. (in: high G+C Gram-positive bacteria)]